MASWWRCKNRWKIVGKIGKKSQGSGRGGGGRGGLLTWRYPVSWWRAQTFPAAAPPAMWAEWFPPAAGRTQWATAEWICLMRPAKIYVYSYIKMYIYVCAYIQYVGGCERDRKWAAWELGGVANWAARRAENLKRHKEATIANCEQQRETPGTIRCIYLIYNA